jgi:hypothetical protein
MTPDACPIACWMSFCAMFFPANDIRLQLSCNRIIVTFDVVATATKTKGEVSQ